METLVVDILIFGEVAWHQPQTSIVTLMQNLHVVVWMKNDCDVRN